MERIGGNQNENISKKKEKKNEMETEWERRIENNTLRNNKRMG